MEQVIDFGFEVSGAGGDDIVDGHEMAVEAWGDKARNKDSGLTAFAYLWRRFGPPFRGSDDYKDLCAYYLTTNDPEVFVWIHPSASGLVYNVGYLAKTELRNQFRKPNAEWESRFENWYMDQHPEIDWEKHETWTAEYKKQISESYWNARMDKASMESAEAVIGEYPREGDPEVAKRIKTAIADALQELLRPVYVRDCAINLFGRCEDSDTPAERSKYAGYGVPVEAMEEYLKEDEKEDEEEADA